MELHSEDIHAAVWVWYLGPNSRQCVFMCVCVCLRGCVSAYFSPHMGVIWSFVIPCLHTHTLLVLLHFVVFLFVWTKCSLARANTWSVFLFVFFAPVQSSGVLSSLSVLFGPVTLANRHRFDLLQHPVSDWPLNPAKRGCVRLARCEYAQRYRGEARTQMRPSEVGAEDIWCMRSSAVVCLRVYFTVLEAAAGRWRGEMWFGSSEGA